jgi:uncharacterized protein YjiS (DUF1127 family)
MAMAQATRPVSRSGSRGSLGHRVADMTQRVWARYWTRRAERATVAVLHALDDRTLKDIGLDRSEIESMVHGRPPGERRLRWSPAGECSAPGCC